MESVGESLGSFQTNKAPSMFPFAGVVLSTAGVQLLAPVLTISQMCPDKFFIFIPILSLLLLIPLNFYLNILFLLLRVLAHAGAPEEAPSPVFITRHLSRAAHTVFLTTLLLITPLSIHAAVSKESIDQTIGAALVCLALVAIFSSVFKKLLISRGFAPPLFTLCISVGFLITTDPILFVSHNNYYDLHVTHHFSIHFFLMVLSLLVSMLSVALLLLRAGAADDGQYAAIQAENLVIGALSVAITTLLIGGYMKVYLAVVDMEVGPVGAVEI